MRSWRVVFRNAAGKRYAVTVRAEDEPGAILAARQQLRHEQPRFGEAVAGRAVPTTKG